MQEEGLSNLNCTKGKYGRTVAFDGKSTWEEKESSSSAAHQMVRSGKIGISVANELRRAFRTSPHRRPN